MRQQLRIRLQFRRQRRCRCDPWAGKIPWRRKWHPTAVFLPEKFSSRVEKPGELQFVGSQKVGHNWVYTYVHAVVSYTGQKVQHNFNHVQKPKFLSLGSFYSNSTSKAVITTTILFLYCFIFLLGTHYPTQCIFITLFVNFFLSLECKFHAGMDFCVFCSLL